MAESFFATLEREVLNRRCFHSQADARMAIFQWLEGWYNPHRRHSALGYLSPINFGVFSRICGSLPAPVADPTYGTGRFLYSDTTESRTRFWWSVSLCC